MMGKLAYLAPAPNREVEIEVALAHLLHEMRERMQLLQNKRVQKIRGDRQNDQQADIRENDLVARPVDIREYMLSDTMFST